MKYFSNTVLLAVLFISLSSCYNYHLVQTYDADSAISTDTTVYSYFWGNKQIQDIQANCREGGIARVKVRKTVGHYLLTTITLGIVSPVKIEWYCIPADEDEEELP